VIEHLICRYEALSSKPSSTPPCIELLSESVYKLCMEQMNFIFRFESQPPKMYMQIFQNLKKSWSQVFWIRDTQTEFNYYY
jgi:hypothetical protein